MALGSNVAQQATKPFPNTSWQALGRALVNECIDSVADPPAPAGGPVGAADFLRYLEQIDACAAEPAVGLRHADRAQIGLQQGRRDPVCEPPEALRRERFFVNQAADRSRTMQGTVIGDGYLAVHYEGASVAEIRHKLPLHSEKSCILLRYLHSSVVGGDRGPRCRTLPVGPWVFTDDVNSQFPLLYDGCV